MSHLLFDLFRCVSLRLSDRLPTLLAGPYRTLKRELEQAIYEKERHERKMREHGLL